MIRVLLLGIFLGTFSKYLDYRQAELPYLLGIIDRAFDFHNFLGGFAPWILIAVCLSVFSRTPARAAAKVFVFFVGMVSSYYIYCKYAAGFFPRSYAMIWIGFTVLSPLLAFICWFAKSERKIALLLFAGIVGVLINTTFSYGMFYISVRSWLNVIVLLIGIAVLHRSAKETAAAVGAGIILAWLMEVLIPVHIW